MQKECSIFWLVAGNRHLQYDGLGEVGVSDEIGRITIGGGGTV